MLFRMCKKIELLLFNSKKIDNYCEDLLNILNDDDKVV